MEAVYVCTCSFSRDWNDKSKMFVVKLFFHIQTYRRVIADADFVGFKRRGLAFGPAIIHLRVLISLPILTASTGATNITFEIEWNWKRIRSLQDPDAQNNDNDNCESR